RKHPYFERAGFPVCDAVAKSYQGFAEPYYRAAEGRLKDHAGENEFCTVVGAPFSRDPRGPADNGATDVSQMLSTFHEELFGISRLVTAYAAERQSTLNQDF